MLITVIVIYCIKNCIDMDTLLRNIVNNVMFIKMFCYCGFLVTTKCGGSRVQYVHYFQLYFLILEFGAWKIQVPK